MIYLIIGPSCSGKTQIVTNSFILPAKSICCHKDIIKITQTDNSILIGDYTVTNKVRGTDKIGRNQLKLIAPQIIKSFHDFPDFDIVAEGINVCWRFVLDELLPYKEHVRLIYLACSKDTSILRNRELNPTCNVTWFKSVWTRSYNTLVNYGKCFNSSIVDTEDYMNFDSICLNNVVFQSVDISKQQPLF